MDQENNNLILRYSRQLILSQWSLSKQRKIQELKVLIDLNCDSLLWNGAALGIQNFYFFKTYQPSLTLIKGLQDFNSLIEIKLIEEEDSFNLLFTNDPHSFKNKFNIDTRFLLINDLARNSANVEISHLEKDGETTHASFKNISIESSQIPMDQIIGPWLINLALEFV